jgi:hypothetical protein
VLGKSSVGSEALVGGAGSGEGELSAVVVAGFFTCLLAAMIFFSSVSTACYRM